MQVLVPVLVLSTRSASSDRAVRASGHMIDDTVHIYVNSIVSACADHFSKIFPVTRAAENFVGHRLIARVPGRSRALRVICQAADQTMVKVLAHVPTSERSSLHPAGVLFPYEVSHFWHQGGKDCGCDKARGLQGHHEYIVKAPHTTGMCLHEGTVTEVTGFPACCQKYSS